MDLSVRIGGVHIKNPVAVASGTFGYGSEYESLSDMSSIGTIFTKVITRHPRQGNDVPRIIETPSGLLNSIGMANVGVEAFIQKKLPYLLKLNCAVFSNIGGSTENEYLDVVRSLEQAEGLAGYEINISCPNVKHGGLSFGTDPVQVESLTAKIRRETKRALIIKLTPNVTDITAIARAAENGGADAVSCINTMLGMVIDINKKRPVLPAGIGGLSGPAIRPTGVALTYRVCRAVKIPVWGMGGIMSAQDAIQYLLAGSSAIQIGTANFVDPSIPAQVLTGIQDYMRENSLKTIKDFHSLMG